MKTVVEQSELVENFEVAFYSETLNELCQFRKASSRKKSVSNFGE